MGKWNKESCLDCDFALKELDRLICTKDVFEIVEMEELLDKTASLICQMGKDGSYYLVGSQIPREGLEGREEPVRIVNNYDQLKSVLSIVALYRYREEGDTRFEEYWKDPYTVPTELDEFSDDALHEFMSGLPQLERDVVFERNFTQMPPRMIEYLQKAWPESKGDKVRMIGKDVHSIFARADDEVCPYGQRFGRPFYRAIDEFIEYDLIDREVDHGLPKGMKEYEVSCAQCGSHYTVVLSSKVGVGKVRTAHKELGIICESCFEDNQAQSRKKLEEVM